MSSPFFTVIIPTFNRAELLCQAIQSVLGQTFDDFELIVVDDHSTDNTVDIVLALKDSRITYVVNDHAKGGAGTRNAGISRARGKWVTFLDDDDFWLPRKLELQYGKIRHEDESAGLIYAGYAAYDFDKKKEISTTIPEKEGWLEKDLLYENFIGTFSTVAIRRQLLHDVRGLDERFEGMQDMELYVRIASVSRIVFIPEKVVLVRRSNADRISLDPQKKLNSSLLFWRKYRESMNKNYRLHHRAATRVFINAFKLGNHEYLIKSLPWTLAGLLVDPHNVLWLLVLIYEELKLKIRRRGHNFRSRVVKRIIS